MFLTSIRKAILEPEFHRKMNKYTIHKEKGDTIQGRLLRPGLGLEFAQMVRRLTVRLLLG